MPTSSYLLRIHCLGPLAAPFGWQIISKQDSKEIACSESTFASRILALVDSAKAAAAIALDDDSVELFHGGESHSPTGAVELAASF